MSLLIKDLSKLTNIPPGRIRKWQERYNILCPRQGKNGYWYYSNIDYRILSSIQYFLSQGKQLHQIMALGPHTLFRKSLELRPEDVTLEKKSYIQLLKEGDYESIGKILLKEKKSDFPYWIRKEIQPLVVSVGRAWEIGIINVADEHAFTRWFTSFLFSLLNGIPLRLPLTWLVCSFPRDKHELGALMYYCILRSQGHCVRYVGMLPYLELLNEVQTKAYKKVSISVVIPRSFKEKKALEKDITSISSETKVEFGGYGSKSVAS